MQDGQLVAGLAVFLVGEGRPDWGGATARSTASSTPAGIPDRGAGSSRFYPRDVGAEKEFAEFRPRLGLQRRRNDTCHDERDCG
jgi:hypothetical protein